MDILNLDSEFHAGQNKISLCFFPPQSQGLESARTTYHWNLSIKETILSKPGRE